ncbi:MAG: hypothetical protein M0D57_04255 [Sphingobacteriales bacterium JAD_PAG50586_3]|nr:MAG: hypothetical protein M0D57_04255 [Sphingobacteriales bacterium JAD_PAG50586_3]
MKNVILIIIISLGSLASFNAAGNKISTTTTATPNTTTETVETPRRPGNGNMRRSRSNIFSINVGRYNGKIKTKYEKEMKALANNAKSGKEKRADRKAKRISIRTT